MRPRGGVVTQRSAKASWFTPPTATKSYKNRHFRDFALATHALTQSHRLRNRSPLMILQQTVVRPLRRGRQLRRP